MNSTNNQCLVNKLFNNRLESSHDVITDNQQYGHKRQGHDSFADRYTIQTDDEFGLNMLSNVE